MASQSTSQTPVPIELDDDLPLDPKYPTLPEVEKLLRHDELDIVDNPKGKNSDVWKKFGLVNARDSESFLPYAVCKDCKKVYSYKSSRTSGTSTLNRHLTTTYVAITAPSGQKRMTQYLQSPANKPVPTMAKKEMTAACVAFAAKDLRAFNTVSGDGFQQVISAALSIGRRFGEVFVDELVPHRTTVSRALGEKASEIRILLQPELKAVFEGQGGGITLDGWTEKYSQTAYIGLTVHYLLNWKMVVRSLFMTEFDSEISKTGENIRTFVMENLAKYGLTEAMCQNAIFVSDAGSNMVKAFNLPRRLQMKRITCACHRLNTVLSDVFQRKYVTDYFGADVLLRLEPVHEVIKKVKELVEYFKRTALMKQLKISLKQQVSTRWNSHVIMLESIHDQYDDVLSVLESRNENEKMPEPAELMNDLVTLLKAFKVASDDFSQTLSPSLHLVVPTFQRLKKLTEEFHSEYSSLMKLAEILLLNLEKKFLLESQHKVACFLHPPFRKLRMFDSTERATVLAVTRSMIAVLTHTLTGVGAVPAAVPAVPAKRKSARFDFSEFEDAQDWVSDVDEVSRYYELVRENNVSDSIQFWKDNSKKFPGLSALTAKILAVPASSTESERLFSSAGFVLNDERTSLKSDKADDILFLYSNRDKF